MNYSSISIKSNKNKSSKNKILSLLSNKITKTRDTIIATRDIRRATLSILRENTLRLLILSR
jgi:ribosomal protein L19